MAQSPKYSEFFHVETKKRVYIYPVSEGGGEIKRHTEATTTLEKISKTGLTEAERYTDRIVEVEHTEEGKETLRRDHL